MLAVLNDRYTFLVDPPVAQSESDVLAGTYGGIGVQVRRSEKGDLTLYPFIDSPTQAAGIEDGDILLAINGTPVDISQQPDAIDQMLRGEVKEGSGVTITFRKSISGEEKTVFVAFAVINVPSVVWRTVEDQPEIGYIQILIFTSRTPDELTAPLDLSAGEVLDPDVAMDEAIRQGYLLDLDSFVQVSVDLSDDFADFVAALYPVNEGDPLVAKVNGQPQHIYPGGRGRLVREVKAFDGTLLSVGGEYAVTWIDHHPPLVGLAAQSSDPVFAMTPPDALIVTEIPSEIRAASENCDPIPPFHLRDLEDETLDEYGEFYDWNAAQTAMQRAARELCKSIQIVNGYSNTVTSCDPESE